MENKLLNKEVEVKVNEFKGKFELSDEEIKKLPVLRVKLVRTTSKKGNVFHSCIVRFNDYKKPMSRIEDKKYNIALLENKVSLERDEFVKDCHVRFSKGFSTKNKKDYYIYDVFFSKSIRFSFFLDELDLKEFELMNIKFNFIDRGNIDDFESDLYNSEI